VVGRSGTRQTTNGLHADSTVTARCDNPDVDWQDIDWGNMPAWLGSILTGGSLLLGFYIILRDRRHREETQASLVSCYWFRSDESFKAIVHNTSLTAVTNVSMRVELDPWGGAQSFLDRRRRSSELSVLWAVIGPGEEMTIELPLSHHRVRGRNVYRISYEFVDGHGRPWSREKIGGPLHRRLARASSPSVLQSILWPMRRWGPAGRLIQFLYLREY